MVQRAFEKNGGQIWPTNPSGKSLKNVSVALNQLNNRANRDMKQVGGSDKSARADATHVQHALIYRVSSKA